MYTALKAKIPFLDINQEREFGYEGYQGMLELVRQLGVLSPNPRNFLNHVDSMA
jgi:nitrogenase molybdenum-cofactor synthesis protein NifE